MITRLLILLMCLNLPFVFAETEYKKADKHLNETYQQVMKTLSSEQKKSLRDAQRLWIKERDKECFEKRDKENCLTKVTTKRANELVSIIIGKEDKDTLLYDISENSQQYFLQLEKRNCKNEDVYDICDITLRITSKSSDKINDKISERNVFFFKNSPLSINLSNTKQQLYGNTYSIVINDFNFDKQEDIAFWTGNDGSYGGPAYKVYLFDHQNGKFVFNQKMSQITENTLGLFRTVDNQLVAYDKSGCCDHSIYKYSVINNQPVLKELIEESLNENNILEVISYRIDNGRKIQIKKETKKFDAN